MNLVVQPCFSSWLSLKLLCLSKQPITFLIAPSSRGSAKTQKGVPQADWKPDLQVSAFKSMQLNAVLWE